MKTRWLITERLGTMSQTKFAVQQLEITDQSLQSFHRFTAAYRSLVRICGVGNTRFDGYLRNFDNCFCLYYEWFLNDLGRIWGCYIMVQK
jgi:hypothetical protein